MCINKNAIESSIASTRHSICHFPTALMCMILSSLATSRAAKQFESTEQDCSRANIWKQQTQALCVAAELCDSGKWFRTGSVLDCGIPSR